MQRHTISHTQWMAQCVHAENHTRQIMAAARKAGFEVVGDTIIAVIKQEKK